MKELVIAIVQSGVFSVSNMSILLKCIYYIKYSYMTLKDFFIYIKSAKSNVFIYLEALISMGRNARLA